MGKLVVTGGKRLEGRVNVSGAKNAALPIIVASLMAEGQTILENVPRIADVDTMLDIISHLGCQAEWTAANTVKITVPRSISHIAPYDLVKKLRASNLLLGALLAGQGKAEVSLPGGDNIGFRPMDLHLKGLQALGAELSLEHGFIKARCSNLRGAKIYLDFPSVGATENIMMAACRAKGVTLIENVAKEPEIVDLANFLNAMGAKVRGAGTDLIKVEGVKELQVTAHSIIPDRIEAGTFMVAAAITGGNVLIENVIPYHLQPVVAKLKECGAQVEESETSIRVVGHEQIQSIDLKTLPYPGFPTDLQSQMMALLTLSRGTSVIVETVYENRLQVAEELKKMGARIKVEGQTAVIMGVEQMLASKVRATDIRAGAALVLAGLAAWGETEIYDVYHIDRGYQQIDAKLKALGAQVYRHSE